MEMPLDTILIVDDDPYIRKLLRNLLEKEQFNVLEACNGKECVDLYLSQSPSAVILDIVMPEKDGISAIREIRKQHNQAKIIAVSGGLVFKPEAYLNEAKDAGADRILSKPFDHHRLISTVHNLLDHPRKAAP